MRAKGQPKPPPPPKPKDMYSVVNDILIRLPCPKGPTSFHTEVAAI